MSVTIPDQADLERVENMARLAIGDNAQQDADLSALDAKIIKQDAAISALEARIAKLEAAPAPTPTPTPVAKPLLGVYTSSWRDATGKNLPTLFDTWKGGEPSSFVLDFNAGTYGWNNLVSDWALAPWEVWTKANGKPVFMWTIAFMFPYTDANNVTTTYSFIDVANGAGDAAWNTMADRMMSRGFDDAIIRVGHEMDGGTWRGRMSARGKEAAYVAAFQRIVSVMRARQPANKWRFVLNPTQQWALQLGSDWLAKVYPGDNFCDAIGLDFYDAWAPGYEQTPADRAVLQQARWADFFLPQLEVTKAFAKARGKPMMFCEWGAHWYVDRTGLQRGGMDNPYWMEQTAKWILDPANNVVAHCYYNTNGVGFNPNDRTRDQWSARLSPAIPTMPAENYPTYFPRAGEVFRRYFG
jgi:hypothetical protein